MDGRQLISGERQTMTQYELNQQIAKQTGESMTEIRRRGFNILVEPSDDADDWPVPLAPTRPLTTPVS